MTIPESDGPTAFSTYILAQMKKMNDKNVRKFQRKVSILALDILDEEEEEKEKENKDDRIWSPKDYPPNLVILAIVMSYITF